MKFLVSNKIYLFLFSLINTLILYYYKVEISYFMFVYFVLEYCIAHTHIYLYKHQYVLRKIKTNTHDIINIYFVILNIFILFYYYYYYYFPYNIFEIRLT